MVDEEFGVNMMLRRVGFLGTLSAIAMGVVTPTAYAQSTAALTEAPQVDIAVLCREILDTRTTRQFLDVPDAVAALNDEADPCHQVALVQWLRLIDENATGAITPAASGGYTFL